MKNLLVLTGLAFLVAISCKSYEEGPGLTFRKAENRITKAWAVDKAYDQNGAEISGQYDQDRYLYREDGVFEWEQQLGGSFQTKATGTWEFINDKEQVATFIDGTFSSAYDTLSIMKLTNDEYWYTNTSGFEFRLVPAASQ